MLRGPRVVLVRASGRWLTTLSWLGERILVNVLAMTLGLGSWFRNVCIVVSVSVVPLVRRWLRRLRKILLQMRLVIWTAMIRLLIVRFWDMILKLILGRIRDVLVLLVVRARIVSVLGLRGVSVMAVLGPTTLVPLFVTRVSAPLRQLARLTLTGAIIVIRVVPMPAVL